MQNADLSIKKDDIDLFENLTDSEFLELKDLFHYKKYKKGAFIIAENDMVKHVYFIRSGLVKLSYFDDDNKEFILSFAQENWWETDFPAFYNQTKSSLTLQCIEDTETYGLSFDDYTAILDKHSLSKYFLEKSIKGHIANQNRILSLLKHKPKEQYEQFLQLYPSLLQRIPKSVLCLYLGISRETLSRLYKTR
ncbi:cAMP-binding domain of CRP or a regulatory subunit of cAMP-dependent protein kinases [Pontibacter chinhatensis]|uniref:cAMP-binding domain of CRP or a regulatory subunit of cAMP-dependent protein kinases n=2 Tax=Pontibacter chinhatensis TaxID=1436961 RepID=A0A1I2PGI2_9BACT|nr:cAMP-binding domain of CRP or a regulatory subunit of cAMP-dependent protein kinases [Pontibacter chinhatensis]